MITISLQKKSEVPSPRSEHKTILSPPISTPSLAPSNLLVLSPQKELDSLIYCSKKYRLETVESENKNEKHIYPEMKKVHNNSHLHTGLRATVRNISPESNDHIFDSLPKLPGEHSNLSSWRK